MWVYNRKDCCLENSLKNLFASKVSEHISSGLSMSAISYVRSIEKKHDVYRSIDYRETFCESLRDHPIKIINFKKNKWSF